MMDMGGVRAKVLDYILDSQWVLSVSSNAEVNKIWAKIREVKIPKSGYMVNTWVWSHLALGEFTLKSGYHALRVSYSELDWAKIVWSSYIIPKYSCCSYRALMGCLLIKDRMCWMNLVTDLHCVLCKVENETHHIYFLVVFTVLTSDRDVD